MAAEDVERNTRREVLVCIERDLIRAFAGVAYAGRSSWIGLAGRCDGNGEDELERKRETDDVETRPDIG